VTCAKMRRRRFRRNGGRMKQAAPLEAPGKLAILKYSLNSCFI
jgi:hypothetical protein